MFDIDNNGLIQKIHLKCNAFFSKCLKKVFDYAQCQIIVCGFPRSGTSLLYNMLSTTLPGFRYAEFEKYFVYNIHKIGNLASKAPLDILHIKHIDKLNINNKKLIILIVIRDIRDIITSRHPIYPDDYFIGYDHSWWPQNSAFTKWKYDAPGVIPVHHAIQRATHRSDTFIIKYEELVINPDHTQKEIEKKFGIIFNGHFSEYHKKPEKHAYRYAGRYSPKDPKLVMENKSSSTSRIHRWKTSERTIERVKQQFSECAELFSLLEFYGYEKSREWFNLI